MVINWQTQCFINLWSGSHSYIRIQNIVIIAPVYFLAPNSARPSAGAELVARWDMFYSNFLMPSQIWLVFGPNDIIQNGLRDINKSRVSKLCHHWFRQWLVAGPVPSHYLSQCWNIANLTLRKKSHWNLNRNSYIFIHENAFEKVIWEMAVIFCPGLNELKRRYNVHYVLQHRDGTN